MYGDRAFEYINNIHKSIFQESIVTKTKIKDWFEKEEFRKWLLCILKVWNEKNPSKEVIEDFKKYVKEENVDVYAVVCYSILNGNGFIDEKDTKILKMFKSYGIPFNRDKWRKKVSIEKSKLNYFLSVI